MRTTIGNVPKVVRVVGQNIVRRILHAGQVRRLFRRWRSLRRLLEHIRRDSYQGQFSQWRLSRANCCHPNQHAAAEPSHQPEFCAYHAALNRARPALSRTRFERARIAIPRESTHRPARQSSRRVAPKLLWDGDYKAHACANWRRTRKTFEGKFSVRSLSVWQTELGKSKSRIQDVLFNGII